MSKGEGTTPQTRKANAMNVTVNEVLNQYVPIQDAERLKKFYTPYIEFILKHADRDRITVRELGEELIGVEKYHEKHRNYKGELTPYRTYEATEVTGTLTHALRKLCKMGVLTYHKEKDMSTLIEIECEDYAYFDQEGHQLPNEIEVTLADGSTIKVKSTLLPGVEERFGKMKKKVHPILAYYTFNK